MTISGRLNRFDAIEKEIIDTLHQQTQLCRSTRQRRLRVIGRFLTNPDTMRSAAKGWQPALDDKLITLPQTQSSNGFNTVGVDEALRRRRSASRADITGNISIEQLSATLSSLRVTRQRSPAGLADVSFDLRSYPSAGALYPCQVYVVPGNVQGLRSKPYRYDPRRHALADYDAAEGSFRDIECGSHAADPACAMVITATLDKAFSKYGSRAYRFALLEAGHIGQNIMLAAACCNLASLAYGAFYDRELEDWLGITEADETIASVILLGREMSADDNGGKNGTDL